MRDQFRSITKIPSKVLLVLVLSVSMQFSERFCGIDVFTAMCLFTQYITLQTEIRIFLDLDISIC